MLTASSVVIFTAFLARPMISALYLLILWLWLLVCNFFLLVGLLFFFLSFPEALVCVACAGKFV